VIIIDDYATWDGCTRAVHDFLSARKAPEGIQTYPYGSVTYQEATCFFRGSPTQSTFEACRLIARGPRALASSRSLILFPLKYLQGACFLIRLRHVGSPSRLRFWAAFPCILRLFVSKVDFSCRG
jgi:hypothetical protein